jgi:hypothetical protein
MSGLLPSGFTTKILYAFIISPMRATSPTYLIILDLISLIIFGEGYNLWYSSLFSLFQLPATSQRFLLLELSMERVNSQNGHWTHCVCLHFLQFVTFTCNSIKINTTENVCVHTHIHTHTWNGSWTHDPSVLTDQDLATAEADRKSQFTRWNSDSDCPRFSSVTPVGKVLDL